MAHPTEHDRTPNASEEPAPYSASAPLPSTTGRVRTHHLQQAKDQGRKFTMLTCYDASTATVFDTVGIDVLLVGDSAAGVVYGYRNSLPVTVEELLPLAGAVARTARRALVMADLPFGSYQGSPEQAYATAVRFMKEAQVAAVKLEGGAQMAPQIQRLVAGGIPVCAHIGFTPQHEHALGGYRVQGRGADAEQVLADAHAVQDAGAFAVLLEMVPADLAAQITHELNVPTIGIGAGTGTDAQVLVWQDAFGLTSGRLPHFVKQYADLSTVLTQAARAYAADVHTGVFPGPEHTF
ncbi:3-methyl-2-oxobutanoate hydroxymethyltransferase [Modestobacter muralis]|uniref:3-methyl-2-oxobutanoate hydroxymethyltransferase n=1 Tax=Modestobacter muralis TaxID=1608614 RepID=A0A6P0EZM8_9ACTN|nr:3-methyl-2-oxobutanoate hydroxymethyltransferase [Modestobacter muralis]NEN53536.1 3-methyl-2-oxobutanoate hydroxymethyltransferase [Modestobacter muralis]